MTLGLWCPLTEAGHLSADCVIGMLLSLLLFRLCIQAITTDAPGQEGTSHSWQSNRCAVVVQTDHSGHGFWCPSTGGKHHLTDCLTDVLLTDCSGLGWWGLWTGGKHLSVNCVTDVVDQTDCSGYGCWCPWTGDGYISADYVADVFLLLFTLTV